MITVTLPLPPEILHPNGRTRSHGYRASMVRKARGEARLIGQQAANGAPLLKAAIRSTWYMPRRRDEDGLLAWLKPYIDGLCDAGLIKNDSGVTLLPPTQITGAAGQERKVVLTIESLGGTGKPVTTKGTHP